ncbi:MAG: response regulator transcription factor [Gammaproteobacteria bacterium]
MNDSKNPNSPSLLLVDDDKVFCQILSQALRKRGYEVRVANDVPKGIELAEKNPPEYAVIDLKMPGPSGLELVKYLNQIDENTRIVVLTGYASIATAVEAVKLGATHYLTKPADGDEIIAALNKTQGDESMPVADNPMSIDRLEWEYLQKILTDCEGNISAAARRLGMHRRTLQLKLQKRPVKK